ncbi:DMT family transporter [Rhodobacteraceae bacterium]|nr:DMT family transporter [Paracoccaceae bacterium]
MKLTVFDNPTEDRPKMALMLLLIGVVTLAFQDTIVKYMTSYTTFWQFQTIRSTFILFIILLVAQTTTGFKILRPRKPFSVFLRSTMLAICMFFFFGGASHITAAQMGAGLYTYPLFVTLLAGPLLGEKIGPFRLSALALGAIGSTILLNPFSDKFSFFQIMPIIAGLFYAFNIIILRKYCRTESPLTLVLAVSIVFLLFGISGTLIISTIELTQSVRTSLPFLFGRWPTLTLFIFLFCIGAACLNLLGNICLSRAYQTAESSWLAPLDFSYLLFLTIWAKIIFGAMPSLLETIGMLCIVSAGMIITLRETHHKKENRS